MATRILSHGDSGRHDNEVLSKVKTRWKFSRRGVECMEKAAKSE